MYWMIFGVICFAVLINESQQLSTINSPDYVGGVVEYTKLRTISENNSPQESYSIQLQEYLNIIKSPQTSNVDILVFPESSLNGRQSAVQIPKAEDRISPCVTPGYDLGIYSLSCAARDTRKYLVINLTMKRNCSEEATANNDTRPCKPDGWNLYNTNVVFDRTGTVISTYRKFNLFGEAGINTTLQPDISYFTTDFGVTFGHFICFDLMFYSPAIDLINLNITDFVFPSMWFSELPFLTAVQAHRSWVDRFQVNLLASGANFPSIGSTGSGIYTKHGDSDYRVWFTNQTDVIIMNIPKIIDQNPQPIHRNDSLKSLRRRSRSAEFNAADILSTSELISSGIILNEGTKENSPAVVIASDVENPPAVIVSSKIENNQSIDSNLTTHRTAHTLSFYLKRDQLDVYSFTHLNFTQNISQIHTVCHGNHLCCDFNISVGNLNPQPYIQSYNYMAVAYDGLRTFDGFRDGHVLACAVIACTTTNLSGCGTRYGSDVMVTEPYRFETIDIQGRFRSNHLILTMPSTLNFDIVPLRKNEFSYNESDDFISNGNTYKNISMTLQSQRSDLYTFGIWGRDYGFVESSAIKLLISLPLIFFSVVAILLK